MPKYFKFGAINGGRLKFEGLQLTALQTQHEPFPICTASTEPRSGKCREI